jgi:hypothetical protein
MVQFGLKKVYINVLVKDLLRMINLKNPTSSCLSQIVPLISNTGMLVPALERIVKKEIRRSQRDVVYLGSLVYEPKCGVWGVAGSQPMSTAMHHGAQINFGDLTSYLTIGQDLLRMFNLKKPYNFMSFSNCSTYQQTQFSYLP